ncbi:MAG: leucine-rich repeat protein [Synergistaceae bacterium]|nr:leucine-rich repeat protein [Synergistaceae bacterium]
MDFGTIFYCSKCMHKFDEYHETCPFCGYNPSIEEENQRVHTLQADRTMLHKNRYLLGAVIGEGGFGITYAAFDRTTNQPVAVKEYFPMTLCERDAKEDKNVVVNPSYEKLYQFGLQRFIKEAQTLGSLEDVKNVVPVIDYFEENNTAYIVMKFIRGVTLQRYVNENKIPPQKVLSMMKEIIEALIEVHKRGIFHMDISPKNIMVQEDNSLVLIDFGSASLKGVTGISYNRDYAPVEQIDGTSMAGSWMDIYALSATLYHLICGEAPPSSLARQLKDNIIPIQERKIPIKKFQAQTIMEGLAVQQEKRIQSMEVFYSRLYNILTKEEKQRQRALIFRVISAATLSLIAGILITVNFTYGLFLGDGLRFSLRGDGFHVRGFADDREKLSIPAEKFGVNVVKIDRGAFQGAETLRDASIPGTVETIGEFAFNGCENLTTVKLDDGVQKIYSQAFANCQNLQAVITPNTLKAISPDAFTNSQNHIILLEDIDNQAASIVKERGLNYAHIETKRNATGITIAKYETEQLSINFPDFLDGQPVTEINSGVVSKSIFPRKFTAMIENVKFPANLEKIGDYAFDHVPLMTALNLPEKLQYIGKNAFSGSFITSVNLPESVNFVGAEAFSICMDLKRVKLSPNMKEIPIACFGGDKELSDVIIPEGITKINEGAFILCEKLSRLEIPEGVKIIEFAAFEHCSSLQNLYLPQSLNFMHIGALEGCPNFLVIIGYENSFAEYFCGQYGFRFYDLSNPDENIIISPEGFLSVQENISRSDLIVLPSYARNPDTENPRKIITAEYILNAQNLKSKRVILPAQLRTIGGNSFKDNFYVESVDCPETLKSIGISAFAGDINLRSVKLNDGLEEISLNSFANCEKLSDIELPSSLKILGARAFENCIGLTKIEIPKSVNMLDNFTFSGTSIKYVNIPGSVSKCETSFYNCRELISADISEGVKIIQGTFGGCSSLEYVVIPSSVILITRSSFSGCKNLRDVWIYSDKAELNIPDYFDNLDTYLFADCPSLTIHAHIGSPAHIYAKSHNIKFSPLPLDDNEQASRKKITFKASERIYSDEEIQDMLLQNAVNINDASGCWELFQYSLGYGFKDLAYQCLAFCEKLGEEYDKICVASVKKFLAQSEYSSGLVIRCFFDENGDYSEHQELKAGDIIVEVDGARIADKNDVDKITRKTDKILTILRADDKGSFQKFNVKVPAEEKLFFALQKFCR